MGPMSRTAARTRRGVRVPRWLSRIGSSGVPEAVTAALLYVYSEAFYGGRDSLSWVQFLADFVICLAAGASGRWPLAGGVGTGVALTAMLTHETSVPAAILALLIPVVSTGSRGQSRLSNIFALWYLCTAVVVTVPYATEPGLAVQTAMIWFILVGAAWLVGRTIHRLRRETEDESALRVESLQAQRRSIARDLHDTVAYATTTMIMRAEEIKLRTSSDPQLAKDLDFIITTGRRSIRDLRGMLEALRRNDPAFDVGAAPSPWRLVTVGDVLESRRAELAQHGLDLQVTVDADLDALPESVRETLAKVVVEATSNMVKHAASGPCRILIDAHDDQVEAVFTNRATPGATAEGSPGLGLQGAAERVEALGGELEATAASGTWVLRTQLPIGGQ